MAGDEAFGNVRSLAHMAIEGEPRALYEFFEHVVWMAFHGLLRPDVDAYLTDLLRRHGEVGDYYYVATRGAPGFVRQLRAASAWALRARPREVRALPWRASERPWEELRYYEEQEAELAAAIEVVPQLIAGWAASLLLGRPPNVSFHGSTLYAGWLNPTGGVHPRDGEWFASWHQPSGLEPVWWSKAMWVEQGDESILFARGGRDQGAA
jgi:hypothetical protein